MLDWVRNGVKIVHMISRTEADYRDVMIYGPAGIMTIAWPEERPRIAANGRKLLFPNGAYALCFSAEKPEH